MLDFVSEAWRLPRYLALSPPIWLYEYAVVVAAALGAAFSAVAAMLLRLADRGAATGNGGSIEAEVRTRHRAHVTVVAIACAVIVFLAGYSTRDGFNLENIPGVIRIASIFIGIVGGSFFFDKSKTTGLGVFVSPTAFLLYAVAGFDFWYAHRPKNEPIAISTPAPVATPFAAPAPAGGGISSGVPSPEITSREGLAVVSPTPNETASPSAGVLPSIAPDKSTAPPESTVARVDRGMESGDPGTRLKTLREAVRSGDMYLRSRALSKAFAGSDSALRSTALREALETSSTFVVSIEGPKPTADPISERIGRSFQIDIQEAGTASGRFRVSSSSSNTVGSVVVSGQNVSFNIYGDKMFNSGDFCSGSETMVPRRSVLKGRMHCKYDHGPVGLFVGDYDIVTEMLP